MAVSNTEQNVVEKIVERITTEGGAEAPMGNSCSAAQQDGHDRLATAGAQCTSVNAGPLYMTGVIICCESGDKKFIYNDSIFRKLLGLGFTMKDTGSLYRKHCSSGRLAYAKKVFFIKEGRYRSEYFEQNAIPEDKYMKFIVSSSCNSRDYRDSLTNKNKKLLFQWWFINDEL